MRKRLWLDDKREMPEGYEIHATNAYFAIGAIIGGHVSHISFDHDLGFYNGEEDHNNSGYAVAKFIERSAFDFAEGRSTFRLEPMTWEIHSANPEGRRNIEMAMRNAEKYWAKF